MITEELFVDYITRYKDYDKAINRLGEALCGNKYCDGVYESDWNNDVGIMLDIFLTSHFDEKTCDLIYWWMFEDVDKIIYKEDKSEVNVEDIHDLWNYICEING